MRDPNDLRTLEAIELVPVDLNSLLYNAERTIAALRRYRARAGDAAMANAVHSLALDATKTRCWLPRTIRRDGLFYDVRWRSGERSA